MNEAFMDVTVAIDDRRVAEVELHRPPANYFDAQLLGCVVDAIGWAETQGARAVVLCSEGRHFCAGLDFGRAGAAEPEALRGLYERAEALVAGPLPVVVAIQGAAIGGGLGLALAGDFRVAAPDSRFAANFARLGFHHGFGISITLPRAVGPQMALELLVTGRRIDGTDALRIGLVDRLGGDPRAAAHQLAAEIAESAPLAVKAIRTTLRRDLLAAFAAAVRDEAAEQVALMNTLDFGEGVASSLERRPPHFTGR